MPIDVNHLDKTAVVTFAEEFSAFRTWDGSSGWDTTGGGQWTGNKYAHGTVPWNDEIQWYVNPGYSPPPAEPKLPNPFKASGGVLTITAAPADPAAQSYLLGQQYTSGMISTVSSFSQTYGYFEIRAQVPAGKGLWPAFWLLSPSGKWPPEIDVMEVLGNNPTELFSSIHSGVQGNVISTIDKTVTGDLSTGFHTYGVNWQRDYIAWYLDGREIHRTATPSDMHEPMYLIANLAVGGNWPGSPDATTVFPAEFKIDYIRVYKEKPTYRHRFK